MNTHKIQQIIEESISKMKQIEFFYNNHKRIVNPHHIGLLHGEIQLHAFQVSDGNHSGETYGWKNFKIENIVGLTVLISGFNPENSYNPSNSNYSIIFKKIKHK